ncbi:MAG: PUR family DNA/RNA-binding protein [Candidatus Shikimatogenerans bostrichidophilus]|nr:MAG: PUR family DNA/RNA-binding protein [Candidatus Shikimatogenerans bostrichidophilus]
MNKEEKEKYNNNNYIKRKNKEIFSKTLIARSRRYFFDTNETNAGDYFLSITESKKLFLNDGRSIFKKHKIFLYKEDFNDFKKILSEMIKFIYDKKGKEVILNNIEENKDINIDIKDKNNGNNLSKEEKVDNNEDKKKKKEKRVKNNK